MKNEKILKRKIRKQFKIYGFVWKADIVNQVQRLLYEWNLYKNGIKSLNQVVQIAEKGTKGYR